MNVLRILLKKVFSNRYWVFFFLLLLGIYLLNSQHTNFPDEFDNIVGGWYINHGVIPYVGFFSHHNPGAYYLASIITFFTKQSFVSFRIIWAIALYFVANAGFLILKRKFGLKSVQFYALYLLFWAIAATYYWGHMMLSETIVGYLLTPVYVLLLIKVLKNIPLTLKDMLLISIVTSLALLTSLTYMFSTGILVLYCFYIFFKTNSFRSNVIKITGIFAVPYILFFLYLIFSQSLSEFYFQSIIYNKNYYIYNFPVVAGQISTNPLRYGLSIFYNTSIQFHSLLVQLDHPNFSYPLNMLLLLANVVLIVFLLTKKKFALAAYCYIFVTFLNARSEPLTSKETDFHATVYAMISLVNGMYVLYELVKNIATKNEVNKFLYKGLLLILSVYLFFGSIFLFRSFSEKVYTKFMGQAPGIYDAPVVAPIINKIVSPDEYFWIGPFEFQELLYINGKQPSKYHWFLPASSRSGKITSEIQKDLIRNKPKLIVFKEDVGAFGVPPSEFNQTIVNILNEYFFRIRDLTDENISYKPTISGLHNFDIGENFYFDKNRKNEIIDLLLKENIMELQ